MKNPKKNKNILNIGSGFSKEGTHFLDLYPRKKHIIKYNADIDKIPFDDNYFDEVISEFMFEHLKDRKLFLNEVYRVLKPNGIFKLKTDNAGFLFYHNSKSKFKTHYGGYTFDGVRGEDDSHYSLFTFEHIKLFLEENNFETKVKLYNRDNFSFPITFILWLLRFTRFKWITYAQIKAEGVKISK